MKSSEAPLLDECSRGVRIVKYEYFTIRIGALQQIL